MSKRLFDRSVVIFKFSNRIKLHVYGIIGDNKFIF